MISHLFPVEIKAVLDALAGSDHELAAQVAALHRYPAQTKETRKAPALVILAEPQRIYRNGRAAVLRVSLTIESTAGLEAANPNNHLSRVALVHRLFLAEKADRIAELAVRGKLTVDDWGQIPGRQAADSDGTGEKLRSVLVLLVACRLAPPAP